MFAIIFVHYDNELPLSALVTSALLFLSFFQLFLINFFSIKLLQFVCRKWRWYK